MRRTAHVLTLIGVVAAGAAPMSVDAQLPRLMPVPLPELGTNGPEKWASLAMSRSGLIAFTTGYDVGERLFTVVNSRGAVVGRFGKKGSGPGEVQGQFYEMFMNDSSVIVFTAGNLRFTLFRPTGQLITTHTMTEASFVMPLWVVGDSMDVLTYPKEDAVRRLSLATLKGRTVLAEGDSLLASFPHAPGTPHPLPTYTASSSSVVLADPVTYRVQRFTSAGKPAGGSFGMTLPPRKMSAAELAAVRKRAEQSRDRLAAAGGFRMPNGTVIPMSINPDAEVAAATRRNLDHFSLRGIHLDGRDRLWVARAVGDSTIFDVYRERQLLGHLAIVCNRLRGGGVSIAGDWMAVQCLSASPDRDADLRLYRITER